MTRIGDALVTVAAKVHLKLTAATPAVMKAMSLLDGVLTTGDDLKKFGYEPMGVAGQHGSADALKNATGISAQVATTIASHVLSRAAVWAKKKLTEDATGADWDGLAQVMCEVFAAVNESLGLEGLPDAADVAAKLREMML